MTIHAIPGTVARDHHSATIAVDRAAERVTIADLTVDDAALADLLDRHAVDEHADLVRRALSVGARGLLTMGLGVDVAAVEQRVRATLDAAAEEAEGRITELLERGADAFSEGFDPERRSSHVARTLAEFTTWRNEFLERLDPDRAGSHTTTLLGRLGELLGPDGALERRLQTALDPDADGSGLARVQSAMEGRFRELRDLIVEDRGRSAIDIALWDLLGQSAGLPIHAVLGGAVRERISAYNTCLQMELAALLANPDLDEMRRAEIEAMYVKKNNAAVDEVQTVADRFNEQLRAFKEQKKKE